MENFHGIFEAEWCDITDDYNTVYYNVTFLKDVSVFKVGDKIESAYWKHEDLTLWIGDNELRFGLVPIRYVSRG